MSWELAKPIVTRCTCLPRSLQIFANKELSTPPENAITTLSEWFVNSSTVEYKIWVNSSDMSTFRYWLLQNIFVIIIIERR
jgi:hypothetical protein